jgi:FdrA protein
LPTCCRIRTGEYHDSVALMLAARRLAQLPGVRDAAVVMATAPNKAILRQAGLLLTEIEAAGPDDLAIVVLADSDAAATQALEAAQGLLHEASAPAAAGSPSRPRTIRNALRAQPHSNLAVISVAGQYAAGEAWEALKSGLHVLLFSDNVSLRDEIELKKYAAAHALFLMGPSCGTAIINGVALGFANAVPRGPVGIVAAAGTGLQEVSTLLAKLGVGVSQAIGTGGRDLKEEVAGITTLQGLRALQADPHTLVLLVVSKPPSPRVAQRVLDQVRDSAKPTVVCFLGGEPAPISAAGAIPARTLEEAAYLAAGRAGASIGALTERMIANEITDLRGQGAVLRRHLAPGQKYLRGLFSGGTLAAEALWIWKNGGLEVWSNVPLEPRWRLPDSSRSTGHCALDLGEEEFTVGRPHPMIDYDLRVRRLRQEGADPEVGVIVLDVVLGYGAHPDPAAELGPAIKEVRDQAARRHRGMMVVASVTGTDGDPQNLGRQVKALREAGAIVCPCNAAAARLAGFIVGGG